MELTFRHLKLKFCLLKLTFRRLKLTFRRLKLTFRLLMTELTFQYSYARFQLPVLLFLSGDFFVLLSAPIAPIKDEYVLANVFFQSYVGQNTCCSSICPLKAWN
jgi:hypothetical protein